MEKKYNKRNSYRIFLVTMLALASFIFTGCEKGSLGAKNGTILGVVLDYDKNTPIADVWVVAQGPNHEARETTTNGDGKFSITTDPPSNGPAQWNLKVEKYGWAASGTIDAVWVGNGETVNAPMIFMTKTGQTVKGTLKGYPVDAITGSPLMDFTVTQISPSRYKNFDTAETFKENGWSGLESGDRFYRITCDNYQTYITPDPGIKISNTPYDMGVIKMQPLTVSVQGTLRNLPGHVITNWTAASPVVWAESAGKVVATASAIAQAPAAGTSGSIGNVIYTIPGIPVSVGNIAVKCKLRGYDIITINQAVSIPKQRPSGTIAGIDANFENIDPIRRDVRVIITGTAPKPLAEPPEPSTVDTGEIIRVYLRQGGKDIVPYVDVAGSNYHAEAYFSGVITGYALEFYVINTRRGYLHSEKANVTIPEDGNTIYTIDISLQGS
ncbi:MAG: carboxypeptidase regulatory-like domain-containing protein [Candidatus Riflebacteria bacterium]|nr:carboxypeptidase regulatory-like domain-containing protein [Candidatus Riflebacteria bacterium]